MMRKSMGPEPSKRCLYPSCRGQTSVIRVPSPGVQFGLNYSHLILPRTWRVEPNNFQHTFPTVPRREKEAASISSRRSKLFLDLYQATPTCRHLFIQITRNPSYDVLPPSALRHHVSAPFEQ